jgi:hypothetical protein
VTGFRFEANPAGIREVTTGPAVRDVLYDAARAGYTAAKANAPTGKAFMGYKRRLRVVKARRAPDGTWAAWFGTSSPVWHLVEFGGAWTRPRAVLRRALRSIPGIRVEEGSA